MFWCSDWEWFRILMVGTIVKAIAILLVLFKNGNSTQESKMAAIWSNLEWSVCLVLECLLKSEPFNNWTTFDHSKSKCVHYSSLHCNLNSFSELPCPKMRQLLCIKICEPYLKKISRSGWECRYQAALNQVIPGPGGTVFVIAQILKRDSVSPSFSTKIVRYSKP